MQKIERELESIQGVDDVHDFHLWTLTSGMEVCSAHIRVTGETDPRVVLAGAREMPLKVEGDEHRCDGSSW